MISARYAVETGHTVFMDADTPPVDMIAGISHHATRWQANRVKEAIESKIRHPSFEGDAFAWVRVVKL